MSESLLSTASEHPQPSSSWNGIQLGSLIVLAILGVLLIWTAYHPDDIYFQDLSYDVLDQVGDLPTHDLSAPGLPLQIKDSIYARGIGVHGASELFLPHVPHGYSYFMAEIGIDRNAPEDSGSVVFSVYGDGTLLFQSPTLRKNMPPILVCVPVRGRKTLTLQVMDAGDGIAGDYADWAMARFVYSL